MLWQYGNFERKEGQQNKKMVVEVRAGREDRCQSGVGEWEARWASRDYAGEAATNERFTNGFHGIKNSIINPPRSRTALHYWSFSGTEERCRSMPRFHAHDL